jgi:outer membrane protein assembly factor BamB
MSRRRTYALLAAAFVAASASGVESAQSVGAEWPGLWGPWRNGRVTRPTAPITNLREVWRRPTAGGYSEIAVVGTLAVTLELRGADDFVVALDAATGRERWATRIGPVYRGHGGSDDGPISTPAIDGTDVFVVGPHGHFVALDAKTGRERWRHDLVKDFNATAPTWGFAASPLVEGGLVIVPAGGAGSRGLLAFDRTSGRLAWNAAHTQTASYSSAVPALIGGVRQLVVASGDHTFAVLAADGRLLWRAPGPGAEVANSPIVLPDDRILLSYWPNSVMLRIARHGDGLSASEVWRGTTPRQANGPTIYRDGLLFGFAGPFMVCLDADTGRERWRERTGDGTLVGAGSALLFLGQTSGTLHVIDPSAERYTERLKVQVFRPEVRSVTGVSVAPGRVYMRNLKEMAAFAIETK